MLGAAIPLKCAQCAAGAQTKAMKLLATLVSPSLPLMLSVKINRFRDCLKNAVAAKLKIMSSPVSGRQTPIGTIAWTGSCRKGRMRRARASCCYTLALVTGATKVASRTSPHTSAARSLSEESITEPLCQVIVLTLAGRVPATFPRHHWIWADLSIDELAARGCRPLFRPEKRRTTPDGGGLQKQQLSLRGPSAGGAR